MENTGGRTSGWVLGHVGGARVVLAPTWLLVAALLTFVFLPTVRAAAPGLGTVATVTAAAGFPILLAISVLLHELGHGLTARRLGIPVTEYVVTFWGGHTQFDRELRTPGASTLVSLAGPLINAVLALGSLWLADRTTGVVALLLSASALANGFVAVFNVLPGLPLDGGRVLEAAVWKVTGDRAAGTIAAGWVGRILAVLVAVGALAWPLTQGRQPSLFTAVIAALVGGFLWAGASQAIKGTRMLRLVADLDLLALARPAFTIPADVSLAAADSLLVPGAVGVVTAPDGYPVALVDPDAAHSVPPSLRGRTSVLSVATRLAPEAVVHEQRGLPAVRAVEAAQHSSPVVVVIDAGTVPARVLGIVLVRAVAQALGQVGRP